MSRTDSRGLVLDEKLLFELTDPGRGTPGVHFSFDAIPPPD